MNIRFDGNLVVIPIDKAIVVMTRQQFIECLRRGKQWRRQQERSARVAPIEDHNRGDRDHGR